jgi:hypothetical protein
MFLNSVEMLGKIVQIKDRSIRNSNIIDMLTHLFISLDKGIKWPIYGSFKSIVGCC